jgi:O-antigen biosynthesis protein
MNYLIVTPPWTHTSSGVRVLHALCHNLNQAGCHAALVASYPTSNFQLNPILNTPLWLGGSVPETWVVYPEIIDGNPLGAAKVVRYVLGQKENQVFSDSDVVVGYTSSLAQKHGSKKVLTIPTFDRSVFNMNDVGERSGSCFYSNKYDRLLGNKLPDFVRGMTRVWGSVEDVVSIYKSHEMLYAFEDTEAIVNAALCGCKIVLVKTDYFNEIDNEAIFFKDIHWDDGTLAVPEATETAEEMVLRLERQFPLQLAEFIAYTQTH